MPDRCIATAVYPGFFTRLHLPHSGGRRSRAVFYNNSAAAFTFKC